MLGDRRWTGYAPSSLHGLSGRGKNELDMRRMILYIVVGVVRGSGGW